MRLFANLAIMAMLAALAVGCSSDEKDGAQDKATPETPSADVADSSHLTGEGGRLSQEFEYEMSGIPFTLEGTPVNVNGATIVPATEWTVLTPSEQWEAGYEFGPLETDAVAARVVIYRNDPDKPETLSEARARWIKRISFRDSRDPASAALVHDKQVGGMTAHVMSVYGNYTDPYKGQRGFDDNYRFVGVMLEAPDGDVFLELWGPDYTAKIMIEAFMNMIFRIKKTPA